MRKISYVIIAAVFAVLIVGGAFAGIYISNLSRSGTSSSNGVTAAGVTGTASYNGVIQVVPLKISGAAWYLRLAEHTLM